MKDFSFGKLNNMTIQKARIILQKLNKKFVNPYNECDTRGRMKYEGKRNFKKLGILEQKR